MESSKTISYKVRYTVHPYHLLCSGIASADEELKQVMEIAATMTSASGKPNIMHFHTSCLALSKIKVSEHVRKAGIFSLLANETTDYSSHEQVILVA